MSDSHLTTKGELIAKDVTWSVEPDSFTFKFVLIYHPTIPWKKEWGPQLFENIDGEWVPID